MAVIFPNVGDGLTRNGDFLDPAQDWTKARWVQFTTVPPSLYATIWQLGGGSPPSTETPPWIWSGLSSAPNGVISQGDSGGGAVNDDGLAVPAATWLYVATVYDSGTTTISTVVNGMTVTGAFVLDLSAVLPQTSEWLATDSVSDAGVAIGYDRSWQAALTVAELQAERASVTPVRTADLLSNTPLTTASDLADTVDGHDWTVNGTLLTASGPFAQIVSPSVPTLYVSWVNSDADPRNNVSAFQAETGAFLAHVYQNSTVADTILGIAVDLTGHLVIAHAGDASGVLLDFYTASGVFARQVDTGAGSPDVTGILAGSDGDIYVPHTSGTLQTVQRYTVAGGLVTTYDASTCDIAIPFTLRVQGTTLYAGTADDFIYRFGMMGSGVCLTPLHGDVSPPVYAFTSLGVLPSGAFVTTSDPGDPFDVRLLSATGDVTQELKGPHWDFANESATKGGWYDGDRLWLLENTDAPIIEAVDPLSPQTALVTCDLSSFGENFDVFFLARNQQIVPPTPPDLATVTHPIRRIRRSAHLWDGKSGHRLTYPGLQLLVESGVPLPDAGALTFGLRWSDDGGHTWSNLHVIEGAKLGQYKYRFWWRRLGQSRDRIFEVSDSNDAQSTIIDVLLVPDPVESSS